MPDTAESKTFIRKKQMQLLMNAVTSIPAGVLIASIPLIEQIYSQPADSVVLTMKALYSIACWLALGVIVAGVVCFRA
jgi:hypothetical protein